jgi:hypothetical protein
MGNGTDAFLRWKVTRELAWFRVRSRGLWLKWGRSRDLFTTRKAAHYAGRLRWKVLRARP